MFIQPLKKVSASEEVILLNEDQIQSLSAYKIDCTLAKSELEMCKERYGDCKDNCAILGTTWTHVITIFITGFATGYVVNYNR